MTSLENTHTIQRYQQRYELVYTRIHLHETCITSTLKLSIYIVFNSYSSLFILSTREHFVKLIVAGKTTPCPFHVVNVFQY